MKSLSEAESSSSDEETFANALKEATDHQFLKESFFVTKNSQNSVNNETQSTKKSNDELNDTSNVKSLRKNSEQNDKFSNFGFTPELQNFVARKLDEILDASIEEKSEEEIPARRKKSKKEKDKDSASGIKLLKTSTDVLTAVDEIQEITIKKSKKHKKDKKDDSDDSLKYREAAVDPEWVLSQEDTKAWTNKWKNRELKYKKLKNGVLIEQT